MGLCRYLPTPSDRMGIMWSLQTIKDSIILEYGPAGTTHYSMGFFGKLPIDDEQRVFTTHMNEEDVVMGDVSRLEAALIEIDQNYMPKVIFVMGSSISAVIGTDIKGVCCYMEDKVNAKLIPLDHGGFRGDYSIGLIEVYKTLVKELVKEPVEQKHTFNIIGSSVGMYRTASDMIELERLIQEAYGLTKGTILCMETGIEAIATMSSAKINLVISYEGIEAAKLLEAQYGIPYVYGVPYGYKGTMEWLQGIGEVLQEPMNPVLKVEIQEAMGQVMQYKMYSHMYKEKPKAFIYADYDRLKGLVAFMEEMGVYVEHQVCCHTLRAIENVDEKIQYLPHESERITLLESLHKTFVLADDISRGIVDNTNRSLCTTAPFINRPQVAKHLPLVGVRGADFIREYYEEYMRILR